MATNLQFPPPNTGGKTNPVNVADYTTPVGMAVWVINDEFPESFGATQESTDWVLIAA